MITRLIYPLALRAKISYKLYNYFPDLYDKDIRLAFGCKVKMDLIKTDLGHKSIIFNGFYELALTRRIAGLAKKGGLMIDAGANFGYFSCLWASLNNNNRVIAFEASPDNIAPLINNVNKNGFADKIKVVPAALSRSEGVIAFSRGGHASQTGWGGLMLCADDESVEVQADTLDRHMAAYPGVVIDVLKIDTEGADTWVLFGAEKLLKEKRIRHIFFELNRHRMSLLNINEQDAAVFLNKLDYTVEKFSATEFYAYPSK